MRIFQVDAFTSAVFHGNPAAVCLLEDGVDDAWMQAVASEMNLAETAFLERRPEGLGLRWFTPEVEVDLCGHATLASAHVLWQEGEIAECIEFHTRSGVLSAARSGSRISLDFPALPAHRAHAPAGLEDALGLSPVWVGRSRFDVLVEVADEAAVRDLVPDLGLLRAVEARGVIVTAAAAAPGADRPDFVSRFFAPSVGIDEDPVTGSAHCSLAPYWAKRFGRDELVGYQASRRGGLVGVRVSGDRVVLSGEAVTVLRGELV
ncbi:MAG: yddE [Acidimicrobiaceae bacterium]|nr:yddE [Acidimicrobiaceae bacterium]